MICWPDDRAHRILMKVSELPMAYRKPPFFLNVAVTFLEDLLFSPFPLLDGNCCSKASSLTSDKKNIRDAYWWEKRERNSQMKAQR